MDASKEKIRHIFKFFFDKSKNSSHPAENVNNVSGPDTFIANHVQFLFRRFRSRNFYLKYTPHSGRQMVENIVKLWKSWRLPRTKHRQET